MTVHMLRPAWRIKDLGYVTHPINVKQAAWVYLSLLTVETPIGWMATTMELLLAMSLLKQMPARVNSDACPLPAALRSCSVRANVRSRAQLAQFLTTRSAQWGHARRQTQPSQQLQQPEHLLGTTWEHVLQEPRVVVSLQMARCACLDVILGITALVQPLYARTAYYRLILPLVKRTRLPHRSHCPR